MKVLMLSCEWPSKEAPNAAHFVYRQYNYLKKEKINVDVFYFRGSGNPFNYYKAWRKCQIILKNNTYDLVHAQWGQSVIPSLPKKLPTIITYRGDDLEGVVNKNGKYGIKSFVLKNLGKWVSKFADHIIVVSPHLIHKLNTLTPISIIPSGIEFDQIPKIKKDEARLKHNLSNNKFIIIFPNNPEDKRKRFWLFKKAISYLPENFQNLIHVEVAWNKSHREIFELMIASNLLVFTSMHEGSPNVIKEAIACNLPIVSVPIADIPHRIKNIRGCFLTEDNDPKSISEGIIKALNFDYSHYSTSHLVKELDENLLTNKLISIYKAVLVKNKN